MMWRIALIVVLSLTLGGCATMPTRPLATMNLAEAFALAAKICGQIVPAILQGDRATVTRIGRTYDARKDEEPTTDEPANWDLREIAGFGTDIRGHALVGRSIISNQYRIHYRVSYFKSDEIRSELMSCGIAPGANGGIHILYTVGLDRELNRRLLPDTRPDTDRREGI